MKQNGTNLGFSDLLTLLLIAFKLLNVISWSWVWVLSPTWIPLAIALIMVIISSLFD